MGETVFIGFNVSEDVDVALRQVAAKRRVDKSVVLREAVSAYLAAYSTEDGSEERVMVNAISFAVSGSTTVEQARTVIIAASRRNVQGALDAWTKGQDSE